MRVALLTLSVVVSASALSQTSLPYRDAVSIPDKAGVVDLFISFESLTATERSVLDLTPFSELRSVEFLSGVPNDVHLDSTQYARITHLALNDCKLLDLPRWMMYGDAIRFDRLTSLSVRVNRLREISICQLEELVSLDVSFNPGINVACLRNAPALSELLADGSKLDWCQLPLRLTHLSAKLQGTRIALDELSCLSALPGLRSIDISSNAVSGKHLLHYISSSSIDSLYLHNVNISERDRKAFRQHSGVVILSNERPPRRGKVNPLDSGSTIWRSSY